MQPHHGDEAHEWDERYNGDGAGTPIWSGRPNGALVAEASDLIPGKALDVGCGEGADAIWLATLGWEVTAVDPSLVALDRARQAAARADADIAWIHSGLLAMPNGTGLHDLVSAQYPALLHTAEDLAIQSLLGAVAPGGTLLVVHHAFDADHQPHFDAADYVMPDEIAEHLGEEWQVVVHETRPRTGTFPAEAPQVDDLILRARRL